MMEGNILVGLFMSKAEAEAVISAVEEDTECKNLSKLKFKKIEHKGMTKEELLDNIQGMEVLVAPPDVIIAAINEPPPNLKWIHCTWAGLDDVVTAIGWQRARKYQPDFKVTKMQGCYGTYMAEYVITAVLAMEKQLVQFIKDQQNKQWCSEIPRYRSLSSLTLGVLGCGSIGMEVAKKVHALGLQVCAVKRSPPTDEQKKLIGKFYTIDQLDEFLASCDYICNILPGTPETKHLLSGQKLMVCSKKQPVFINVGRSNIIPEDSLLEALDKRWISTAFLDVFDKEPLPSSSPLWEHKNVVMTPHVSCWYIPMTEFGQAIAKCFKQYVNNVPFTNEFNWQAGY